MLVAGRGDAPTGFVAWLEQRDALGQVYLSVVTLHEIEKGIALLASKRASAKALRLRTWLEGLTTAYGDKILCLDPVAAQLAGRLEAKAMAAGHSPGMADAVIAGIAQAHGLVVVTRNTKHFLPFGVEVDSPYEVAARRE